MYYCLLQIYSEENKNNFPENLAELCAVVAKYLGYERFRAEAGIVNYYHMNSTLSAHIDTARSRAFAGNALQVNPRHLQVPVIGGHSDETIVPLFSNLTPTYYCVDPSQADTLTRLVRKAGQEIVNHKQGTESATLAMAWSINEFVDGIIDAIRGSEVVLNCYTANPHFGTRFFAGPTNVGAYGIIQTCCDFPMTEYECFLLNCTIPVINKEISHGEDYVEIMESARKK